MGKLYDLSTYGRCKHGRIRKPGNCEKCAAQSEEDFKRCLLAVGRKNGTAPGTVIRGIFCPGGRTFEVVMPHPDGSPAEVGTTVEIAFPNGLPPERKTQ